MGMQRLDPRGHFHPYLSTLDWDTLPSVMGAVDSHVTGAVDSYIAGALLGTNLLSSLEQDYLRLRQYHEILCDLNKRMDTRTGCYII
jgi:hypothetical protein